MLSLQFDESVPATSQALYLAPTHFSAPLQRDYSTHVPSPRSWCQVPPSSPVDEAGTRFGSNAPSPSLIQPMMLMYSKITIFRKLAGVCVMLHCQFWKSRWHCAVYARVMPSPPPHHPDSAHQS